MLQMHIVSTFPPKSVALSRAFRCFGQLALVSVLGTILLCGCGIVWDADGKRHALGLGYVAWPTAPANQTTVVEGIDVIGASVLATHDAVGLVVGYGRERSVKLDNNQFVTLDCLQCDLANAHPAAGSISDGKEGP